MYAQREDVGAVGCMLYYEDYSIQHAGIVLGLGAHRTAGHSHYKLPKDNLGYMGRLCYAQNVSAVTGACLMTRHSLYTEVGGLNEELAVALNDVDYCLKLRQKGLLNVFTPYAELFHYESRSRGSDVSAESEKERENAERYNRECEYFKNKWKEVLEAHHANMNAAGAHIGFASIHSYNFSDNRFDSHALLDIVKVVEKEKEEFQPDIIFTHNAGDLNIDHRYTFQAVMTATRPMADENVTTVITFETNSATDWQYANHPEQFHPNLYVEINEEDLQAKIDALSEYKFEIRDYPHPRSAKALRVLAEYRGYTSGCLMAEAFEVVRMIERG